MHAPGELAAHVAPQRLDQPGVVAGRVGIGHRPARLAAGGRVAAGEAHPRCIHEAGFQAAAPVVAGPGRQAHRAVHLAAGQPRIGPHQGHAALRVGHEAVGHRLEVQQQCIRLHVVRPRRVAVELGRVRPAAARRRCGRARCRRRISRTPSCCTRRSSSQTRSTTSFGSPVPLMTSEPSSTPSLTLPCSHTGVLQVQAGPSWSSAASVVSSLASEAGLTGSLRVVRQQRASGAGFLQQHRHRVVRHAGALQRGVHLRRHGPRGPCAQAQPQQHPGGAPASKRWPSSRPLPHGGDDRTATLRACCRPARRGSFQGRARGVRPQWPPAERAGREPTLAGFRHLHRSPGRVPAGRRGILHLERPGRRGGLGATAAAAAQPAAAGRARTAATAGHRLRLWPGRLHRPAHGLCRGPGPGTGGGTAGAAAGQPDDRGRGRARAAPGTRRPTSTW